MSLPTPGLLPRVRHYARVFREVFAVNLTQATSFRAHFALMLIMEFFFFGTVLGTVDMVFAHVETIGVWNREQFLFFVCFALAVNQLHTTFVSYGYWRLGDDLIRGNLDFHLLKPLSLHFTVFFRHIRIASVLVIPASWVLVAYWGWRAGLEPWAWVALGPLMLLSFATMVAFETLLATAMFLTIDGTGINFIRMQLQSVSRWPDFIYADGPRTLFTFVLPVLLLANAPVRFLFDPRDSALLLWMLPCFGLLCWLNGLAWRAALDGYGSASS